MVPNNMPPTACLNVNGSLPIYYIVSDQSRNDVRDRRRKCLLSMIMTFWGKSVGALTDMSTKLNSKEEGEIER